MSDPTQPAAPAAAPAGAPAPTAQPAAPAPAASPLAALAKPADAPPAAPEAKPAADPARTVVSPLARLTAKHVAAAQERTASLVTENATLKAQADKVAALEAVVATHAATELAALPSDEHRAAVLEIAGADAAAQLRAISALKKHRVVEPALPVGATTAPPKAPTPTTGDDADAAAYRQHEALRAKAPQSAAAYLLANREAIARGAARAAKPS